MTMSEAERIWPKVISLKGVWHRRSSAISFLGHGGKEALITNPENIARALAGETGTCIVH